MAEMPIVLQLRVQLIQPSADAARIAAEASDSAGRPVRYAASISERWHALTTSCQDARDCDAVLQRLRADTQRYVIVELDQRKRAGGN